MAPQHKFSVSNILQIARARPLVCATILAEGRRDFLETAGEAANIGCDLVELRLDHLLKQHSTEIAEIIQNSPLPVVVTNRSERDGGLYPSSREPRRVALLDSAISCGPALVDIELEMDFSTRTKLRRTARSKGVGIICSHHDFRSTPNATKVARLAREEYQIGADVAKLVFSPSGRNDVELILEEACKLYSSGKLFTIFGVGSRAKFTRLASLLLGSCMVYCFVGKANQKLGQINAKTAVACLKKVEQAEWSKIRSRRYRVLALMKERLATEQRFDFKESLSVI